MNFDVSIFDVFEPIKFYGKDHTYKINGEKCPLSVTRFLGLFTPYFDRDKIAANVAAKQGVDTNSVINQWEFEKDIACLRGTLFHNYIDNYLNKKIIPLDKQSVSNLISQEEEQTTFYTNLARIILQFKSFYEYYNKRFIHLKSEFAVGDMSDTRICGTIDNLSLCRTTGELYIIDYKTNKKYDKKSSFKNTLKYPVQHLEDCKHSIYSLQLNMYRYIIEKYTNIPCKGLVVWFNEKNEECELHPTLELQNEIKLMVDHYKRDEKNIETLTTEVENYIMSIAD